MELYRQKWVWKLVLASGAALIIIISLVYTNHVVEQIKDEEKRRVELWAEAIIELQSNENPPNITFLSNIVINEKSIPAIIADEQGKIIHWNNLNPKKEENPEYRQGQLEQMKNQYPPIPIELYDVKQYLYRRDSRLLRTLKYFPLVQLGLISVFVLFGYMTFSAARRAEQNRVWVGMAKETAHQLGTPITSLVAWIEHLKDAAEGNEEVIDIVNEFGRDLGRLETIAERFSKIGSVPELHEVNIYEIVRKSLRYMERRAPRKVTFAYPEEEGQLLFVKINPPLFDWVLENLLKNALDALEGKGEVEAEIFEDNEFVYVDISDTGKGIPNNKMNTVFKPGYTTKKRGWGLGLSLCKRIIENYHSGRIFVKKSVVDSGSTFRIQLPKN